MTFKYRDKRSPFAVIEAKAKPDQDAVDKIHMNALTALDAAKRGQATHALANTLTEHLMAGVLLWARMGNRALYERAVAAWMAMSKACKRDTQLLDLTTGEYCDIRVAMIYYLRAIPQLEVGILAAVFLEAQRKLWV